MGRYAIKGYEKNIVYSAVRLTQGHRPRTEFEKRTAEAVAKAEEELSICADDPQARTFMTGKLRESIAYRIPYEEIGEVYCSRGTFYSYRKQFVYLIAQEMGLIHARRQQVKKGKKNADCKTNH